MDKRKPAASSRRTIFRFKQFEVEQTDCAMKINTDGVLLGALASCPPCMSTLDGEAKSPRILDIGTGTGVIALMLAQRFPNARLEAIEIDARAARRASENFMTGPFGDRLTAYHMSMQAYEPVPSLAAYDLIVSNPPFFVNALENPDARRKIARHADAIFYDQMLERTVRWLRPGGSLQLILPPPLASQIEHRAVNTYQLFAGGHTAIYSFDGDRQPIRVLLRLDRPGRASIPPAENSSFVIYAGRGIYTEAYRNLLKDFFLAF